MVVGAVSDGLGWQFNCRPTRLLQDKSSTGAVSVVGRK